MHPQLLLLHGALGSASSFALLQKELENQYFVRALDFPGHASTPLPQNGLGLDSLVNHMNDFIASEFNSDLPVHIFGYSMGGYVGLCSALRGNTRIGKIMTLATKLKWSPEIAEAECKLLDPAFLEEKAPHFVAEIKKKHAPIDWKELLQSVSTLLIELGKGNFLAPEKISELPNPCRFLLGDRDKMVTFDETLAAYKSIKGASLAVLPETQHAFEKIDTHRLANEIRLWLPQI
jgi:pimeloyl-ACP methyl ester carboxylesterase